MRLCALAPAKINLGLFLGPTRADGRHELASVMQSISLADELTLEPGPAEAEHDAVICPGAPELERDNLAARALQAFRAATGWEPGPLTLTIVKRVPVAAGMGGGSGDAAAALRLAALASGIDDPALLHSLAGGLGADVPAQVTPGRSLARGAGEILERLPSPREPFGVLVLPIAVGLTTAAVYAQADRLGLAREQDEVRERAERLRDALARGEQLPPQALLANDLQAAAVSLCPEIEPMLARARDAGADVALVSGSGPTVLGLFTGADGPARARRAADALQANGPALGAVRAGGLEPHSLRARGQALHAVPVDASLATAHAADVRNNASS